MGSVRKVFNSGRTLPLEWRKKQLKGIINMITEQGTELTQALKLDLNKVTQKFTIPESNIRFHIQASQFKRELYCCRMLLKLS